MDVNLVVLGGVLSADPEHRTFESGVSLLRCLVTVRNDDPRRVDVIPVTLWDPSDEVIDCIRGRGQRVWVAGTVQRRFWSGAEGRRSQIEVVARAVELTVDDDTTDAEAESQDDGSVDASH